MIKVIKKYFIIYCRKSSRPEDKQAASLPRQLRECQEFVQRLGLQVLGEPVVESGSAWLDGDRAAFKSMIALINSRNDIKGIVAFDSDRLARDGYDGQDLKELIVREKIDQILTCQGETFDTNNTAMFGLKNMMGFEYSLKISKNVKASISDRLKLGIPPYAPKLGYISDPLAPKGQKKPIPHETYFPIFRKVMEMFMSGGYSISKITEEANGLGLRNPRGWVVSKTRMHQMLRDPYYKGQFLFHDDSYIGEYEPLLTPSEFELVQEILTGRSRPRAISRELPLNGFIKCRVCLHAICGEIHTKNYVNGTQGVFTHYRCPNHRCDQRSYIKATVLEDQVTEFLKTIELDPDWIEYGKKWALEMELESQGFSTTARQARQAAHDSVTKRIANLIKTKSEMGDGFDNSEFKRSLDELLLKKKSLEKQLATVEQQFDDSLHWTIKTLDFATNACQRFQFGSLSDKKTVLQAVGSNLTLKDGILAIQPANPFKFIPEYVKNIPARIYRLDTNNLASAQPLLYSSRSGLRG